MAISLTLKWKDIVNVEHSEVRREGAAYDGTRQDIFRKWHGMLGPQWPCSVNGIEGHFTAGADNKVRFAARELGEATR